MSDQCKIINRLTLENLLLSMKLNIMTNKDCDYILHLYSEIGLLDYDKFYFSNSSAFNFYHKNIMSFLKENIKDQKKLTTIDKEKKKKLASIILSQEEAQIKHNCKEENKLLYKGFSMNYNNIDRVKMRKYIDNFKAICNDIESINDNNNENELINMLKMIVHIKDHSLQKELGLELNNIYTLINDRQKFIYRLMNLVLFNVNSEAFDVEENKKKFCLNNILLRKFEDFMGTVDNLNNNFFDLFCDFRSEFHKLLYFLNNYENTQSFKLEHYFSQIKSINFQLIKDIIQSIVKDNNYISIKVFYFLYLIHLFQQKNNADIFLQIGTFPHFQELSTNIGTIDINYFKERIIPIERNYPKINKYYLHVNIISILFSYNNTAIIDKGGYKDKDFEDNIDFLNNILPAIYDFMAKLNSTSIIFLFKLYYNINKLNNNNKLKENVVSQILKLLNRYYILHEGFPKEVEKYNSSFVLDFVKEEYKNKFNDDLNKIKNDFARYNNESMDKYKALYFVLYLIEDFKLQIEVFNQNSFLSNYFSQMKKNNYHFLEKGESINLFKKSKNSLKYQMQWIKVDKKIKLIESVLKDYNVKICILKLDKVKYIEEIFKENIHSYYLHAAILCKNQKWEFKKNKLEKKITIFINFNGIWFNLENEKQNLMEKLNTEPPGLLIYVRKSNYINFI